MNRNSPPAKPTEAELAILRVLWDRGPSTVRDVVTALAAARSATVGYTTILKLMQIMTDKGLLLRNDAERSHIYRPAVTQDLTLRQLAGDLLDRAFNGSASRMLLSALDPARTSPEELAEIRRLLEQAEQLNANKSKECNP